MVKTRKGMIYRGNTAIGFVELPLSSNREAHCLNIRHEEYKQNMHHITGSGELSFCILRPKTNMVLGILLSKYKNWRKKKAGVQCTNNQVKRTFRRR